MKKRLIAVLLTTMLMLCSFTVVHADETLLDIFRANGIPEVATVEVPSNIVLKESDSMAFADGPLTLSFKEKSEISKFDFKATLFMEVVRNAFNRYMFIGSAMCGDNDTLLNELANTHVTGDFTVKITYPKEFDIPSNMRTGGGMIGFNSAATGIFKEDFREITSSGNNRVMTIQISVAGTEESGKPGYITAADLQAGLDDYLGDLSLTCSGVGVENFGTYTILGEVTGTTVFGDPENPIATVNYVAKQNGSQQTLSEKLVINKKTVSAGGSGGTVTPPVIIPVQLTFLAPGALTSPANIVKDGIISVDLSSIEAPEKPGSVFVGWYFDVAHTKPATGWIHVNKNTTLYAQFVNITPPDALNADEHSAYVIGYPDGTVRPDNRITREEVVTIFYRLLKDEKRNDILTDTNVFTDVEANRWSNREISTMSKGGYITGYEDGTFAPAAPITRAEFVTIASRFLEDSASENVTLFTDISGHWAENYILSVAENSWITGYEDGTFRPERNITRAEAMTIINKMLVRYADADSLIAGVKQWIDNPSTAWYYYQVLEATNSHAFTRREDGYSENWTTLLEVPVWQ